MPRCTIHNEFKNGVCVECRRRRQREYQAEMRSARRQLKAIQAVVAQPISLSVATQPRVML